MKPNKPTILLVNPWIHDFAAYDFWAKPLGLLSIASLLREHGFHVCYIDCLDRFHPNATATNPQARNGRGPFLKVQIPKPKGMEDVSRHYCRYGIKIKWFKKDLLSMKKPDLIFITSLMTYWYPGIMETIKIIKEIFPHVPVVLGGIYASLCTEHAEKYSGADYVVAERSEDAVLKLAGEHTGYFPAYKFNPHDLDTYPYPAFDLQNKIAHVPLLTSKGCPFSCAYCASCFLDPKRMIRGAKSVVAEIKFWHEKYQVTDFVFYDDALLADSKQHAIPLLEEIIGAGLKVRFHTPNALHIREISKQIASLMFQAGFKTLRLGLETAMFDLRGEMDTKVGNNDFKQAVICLKQAGFNKEQIGAYLLAGLPGQEMDSIEYSIKEVLRQNITPLLAYYSPIPHTKLWSKAVDSSRYDLNLDPVFTNNAIFPCQKESFSWEKISYLKDLARGDRQ
ncbi:MAG: cobalamin-dependent protein [Deltaproteobacteria bacterium]|nr:cobalamin-dependent protein [Deltaproteobacteria bacterium]